MAETAGWRARQNERRRQAEAECLWVAQTIFSQAKA
jgi:hypothetical protein